MLMPDVITYNGSDKWKQKATELLNQGGGGGLVDDVIVYDEDHPTGQSVVNADKEAEIDLTSYAKTSDIPAPQVQSDYAQSDSSAVDYIKNKPTILALGETSSTAYRGDRGKTAYDHATEQKAGQTASGLYKIGVTAEGHVASATAVQKSDITALGIPASDTNTTYTLGASGNNLTLTPSSGSAQSVTAPYATNAGKVNNHTVGMDIPTPTAGDETKYLGGDGTFQEVSPKREASGSVVSFSDGSTYPLSKCVVDIEPQQDLHGYDYPWAGGAGRNLFDMSVWQGTTASGLSFVVNEDIVTINGTKYGATYVTPSGNFKTLSSGTYYAKAFMIGGTTSNAPSVYIHTDSDLTGNITESEKSFTLESDTSVKFRFAFWRDGATFSNYKVGIVISKTSNIDTFQPYSNICPISGWTEANITVKDDATSPTTTNTYTISFGSADTVYGGTLNVLTGELVVDRAIGDLGDYTWTRSVTYNRFQTVLTSAKRFPALWGGDNNKYVISDSYRSVSGDDGYEGRYDFSISGSYWNGTNYLQVNNSDYTDATAFKTAMTGVKFIYYIATPQTYTLTATQIATLLGNNTIYADTGDISVEYVKEPFEDFATKGYVDAGLSTKQDTLTASTNITIDSNNNISASDAKVLQEYCDFSANLPILVSQSFNAGDYTGAVYKSNNIYADLEYGEMVFKYGTKELYINPNDLVKSGNSNTWDTYGNTSLKSALAARQPYISDADRWKIASNEEAVSAASETYTTLTNITLTPGLWMIKYRTTFPNNSSGYRRIYLAGTASSSSYLGESRVTVAAANGAVTDVIGLDFFLLTESTDFYLRALQNSGSSMNLNGSIRCIRIS